MMRHSLVLHACSTFVTNASPTSHNLTWAVYCDLLLFLSCCHPVLYSLVDLPHRMSDGRAVCDGDGSGRGEGECQHSNFMSTHLPSRHHGGGMRTKAQDLDVSS